VSDKMIFDRAVDQLDEFLREKTVHSVKSINDKMLSLCNDQLWETVEDHQDFANLCSNFEKYCMIKKMTSFGRKQFEAAWEKNFAVEDSLKNAVAMIANKGIMLQEDSLPDFGTGDVEKPSEGFNDVYYANIYIGTLETMNEQLKLENIELRKAMKEMKELINPWA
jgi:hypothetical protein